MPADARPDGGPDRAWILATVVAMVADGMSNEEPRAHKAAIAPGAIVS